MKVKKYVGENIQDTIFKVKADLGSDAIILNTKKYKKGGFLGFFAKKQVEVLAALEENNKASQETLEEIDNLKDMIGNLNQQWQQQSYIEELSEPLATIYRHLENQGIEEDFLQQFLNNLEQDLEKPEDYLEQIRLQLLQFLKEKKPIQLPVDQSQQVVAFVGPTGVGKTTTIAKIAAHFALNENKRVGLITADTYRIAAVQQLKTYSDIVNIPLQVVYDQQELTKLLDERFQEFDLVLVDTAGSCWKDQMQMGKLTKIAATSLIDEVHLLLSMNTKTRDLYTILNNFSSVNPDKLLLTKLDETVSYGDIINLRRCSSLPYSYITFGQDVPDDLEEAHPELLLDYLFEGLGDIDDS